MDTVATLAGGHPDSVLTPLLNGKQSYGRFRGSADTWRFPAKRPLVHRAMSQQALAGKPSASQDDSSNVTPETTQARPPSSMSRPPIFSLRTHFIHGPCSTTMPRLCRLIGCIGTLFSRSCLRRPAAPTGCQDVLGSSQPTSWSKGFWGGGWSPRGPRRDGHLFRLQL